MFLSDARKKQIDQIIHTPDWDNTPIHVKSCYEDLLKEFQRLYEIVNADDLMREVERLQEIVDGEFGG